MPRLTKLVASLPPAVLANNDAWIELIVEAGPSAHRGLEHDPTAGNNIACSRRLRMHLHFRM